MTNNFAAETLGFVKRVELPPAPKLQFGIQGVAKFDFDNAKDQALVVGSDIISFVKGVTEERRQDIVNSALLAQLAANKGVPDQESRIVDWYKAYFAAVKRHARRQEW